MDYSLILHMEDESLAITDKWQVQLSQFFYLLDMGLPIYGFSMDGY